MIQEPSFTTQLSIGGETCEIKVYGNIDKTTGFIYYTFVFSNGNMIILSKFDGDQWRVANTIKMDSDIANLLGKLIEKHDDEYKFTL